MTRAPASARLVRWPYLCAAPITATPPIPTPLCTRFPIFAHSLRRQPPHEINSTLLFDALTPPYLDYCLPTFPGRNPLLLTPHYNLPPPRPFPAPHTFRLIDRTSGGRTGLSSAMAAATTTATPPHIAPPPAHQCTPHAAARRMRAPQLAACNIVCSPLATAARLAAPSSHLTWHIYHAPLFLHLPPALPHPCYAAAEEERREEGYYHSIPSHTCSVPVPSLPFPVVMDGNQNMERRRKEEREDSVGDA